MIVFESEDYSLISVNYLNFDLDSRDSMTDGIFRVELKIYLEKKQKKRLVNT